VAHDLVVIVYDLEVLEFTRAKAVYGHYDLLTIADAKRGIRATREMLFLHSSE
jgi:uncharacterized protein with GYD domain